MGSLVPGWDSNTSLSRSHDDRLSSANLARSFTEIKKELLEMHSSQPGSPTAAASNAGKRGQHALGESHGAKSGNSGSIPIPDSHRHPDPVPEDELDLELDESGKPIVVTHKSELSNSWWQRSNSAFLNEKSATREDLLGSYTPQYLHKSGLHETVNMADIKPVPEPKHATA